MSDSDDLEDYWAAVRPRAPLPSDTTIGEKYTRAMKVMTEAEAEREFELLVQHSMQAHGKLREEAEAVERANLGYYAGYFNTEVQERVERLFRAVHPIFGSTSNRRQLTPEEIIRTGVRVAERQRQGSPIFCNHANENPARCTCDPDCYCKTHTCQSRTV